MEGVGLGQGQGPVFRGGGIVGAQVGKDSLHRQIFHRKYGANAVRLFTALPQPMHAGVNAHMYPKGQTQLVQRLGVLVIYNRLDQIVTDQKSGILRRRVA